MNLPLDAALVVAGKQGKEWFDLYAEWQQMGFWEVFAELRRN